MSHCDLLLLTPPHPAAQTIEVSILSIQKPHCTGESKLVNLYPELDQFSQVDRKGQRYELAGEYTFRFGVEAKAEEMQGMQGMVCF
jgi:hypothetical protein